jgi:hypothetical protein
MGQMEVYMQYRSPLASLNEALNESHKAYKIVAGEILGVDPIELDRLILASIETIAACSTAGWYIGKMIAGESGGATGAAVGACVGVIIVIGAVAYRIYFHKSRGNIICSPMIEACSR